MSFWKWSKTPADNGTADNSCPWPEGMAPSQVNDSARGQMAALAKYRDDISGSLLTTGTSSAFAVASNQGFDTLAHLHNAMIAFVPHVDSAPGPTLSVDGLTAKPIRGWSGVDLQRSVLKAGTPCVVFYNNTSGEFVLHSYYYNPGEIPIGGGLEYWGTAIPTEMALNFTWADGRALSRTELPICYARLGNTFGSGDGSTTFNLPDKRGRVSAAKDDQGGSAAGRLTSASGISGNVLGGAAGAQEITLAGSQIPLHRHNGSTNPSSHLHGTLFPVFTDTTTGGGSFTFKSYASSNLTANSDSTSISQSFTTDTGTGLGGGPHINIQPTIVCNYLIRVR